VVEMRAGRERPMRSRQSPWKRDRRTNGGGWQHNARKTSMTQEVRKKTQLTPVKGTKKNN